jgi:hypothetical protein
VAEDKYAFLDARVANSALSSSAHSTLSADLGASRSAFDAGDYALARIRLDTFRTDLASYAGSGVPNTWRAARDLDNIAGDLFGESASLQFTLARLAAQ